MQFYVHKVANNSTATNSSWNNAQPCCNFVLFRPTWLPEGLQEISNTMRPESTHGRASHRAEFGSSARSLSIKQFLYDWAPPAYDHPCLWRNAKISSIENTPIPRPHLIGNNYLWLGLDYRRNPAASIEKSRTQIEITALKGIFSEQEFIEIVNNLRPVNVETQAAILSTSLATLSFDYRHQSTALGVPTSYFYHMRSEQLRCQPFPAKTLAKNPLELSGDFLFDFTIENYQIDSVFLYKNQQKQIREEEYYFESLIEPGSYIRFLIGNDRENAPIKYPPPLGDQACNYAVFPTKGHALFHAWSKSNDNGSHSIIFKAHDCVINCIVKPAPWTTISWVRTLCANMLEPILMR